MSEYEFEGNYMQEYDCEEVSQGVWIREWVGIWISACASVLWLAWMRIKIYEYGCEYEQEFWLYMSVW